MSFIKTSISLKVKIMAALILIGQLLTSCAPTTIFSDYNRSQDFTAYKSFAWLPKTHDSVSHSPIDNQIVETNIKNLASGELKSRGYVVDVNEPDILLDFYIDVAHKVDHVTTPVYGYAYNYNGYMNNGYMNNGQRPYSNGMYSYRNSYYNNNNMNMPVVVGYTNQDVPYDEGTLTVIVIDRRSNQLIWKGWSVGTVTDESSFEYELPSDIRRLFKEYPIPVIVQPKSKGK